MMKPFPRHGAWAVIKAQVGRLHIDTQVNRKTMVVKNVQQFHVVNPDGITIEIRDGWTGARIARRAEIPASMIAGTADATLTHLGYV